jgi:hypothetical protein
MLSYDLYAKKNRIMTPGRQMIRLELWKSVGKKVSECHSGAFNDKKSTDCSYDKKFLCYNNSGLSGWL